jgi:hypothetical protein
MFYFIKESYDNEILSAYEKLNVGAAKADLWRYLILYKNGGVYLDMDSVIYSNLNSLIKDDDTAIISRENNLNLFVQWCLIFNKKHPILGNTIKKVISNIKDGKGTTILNITGPSVYSEAIRETLKPLELDPYNSTDDIFNNKIKNKKFEKIKCRLYSYDYEGYCQFKHDKSYVLYTDKKSWREEQLTGIYKN